MNFQDEKNFEQILDVILGHFQVDDGIYQTTMIEILKENSETMARLRAMKQEQLEGKLEIEGAVLPASLITEMTRTEVLAIHKQLLEISVDHLKNGLKAKNLSQEEFGERM
jgi:hypothetical protein